MTEPAVLPVLSARRDGDATGATAFDRMAASYDASFTGSAIGTLMRQAAWRRLDACFAPGSHVLELNCGTGEDALYLARRGVRVTAIDASAGMLERAGDKIARAGLGDRVDLRHQTIEQLTRQPRQPRQPRQTTPADPEPAAASVTAAAPLPAVASVPAAAPAAGGAPAVARPFDGVLSNFGGLNCVAPAELRELARWLAANLRPGAMAVVCVMGPLVPWEWAWYLGHAQPGRAFRRLRPGGTPWRGMTIRYPSVGALRRLFGPAFRLRRRAAVGALLPPTYAEGWAVRHPRLLRLLGRWERRAETWPPLPWLADHYLLELERR
jgi:SAM-dependent methyltransferase